MLGTGAMLAIGAGAGLLKNQLAQAAADKQRKANAEMTRYSPWTGMKGEMVKDPSLVGDLMTGAAGGAMLGQGMGAAAPEAAGELSAGTAAAPQYSLGVPTSFGSAGSLSPMPAGSGMGAWDMMNQQLNSGKNPFAPIS